MSVRCLSIEDHRGVEGVVVVCKLGFRVSARGVATWVAAPIRLNDEAGGPRGSIRFPNDYLVGKPGTDVLLVGTAYPPIASPPATEMDVSLRVGHLNKTVRVYGPRVFYEALGVLPGRPGPLEPVPLIYELTYGGRNDDDPGRAAFERRNPIGMGFAADASARKKLVGTPAPPIEDPRAPLSSRNPAPAGFGAIGAYWEPRIAYAGTFDERWRRERAPVLPADFDPRYNAYASPGLWSETPLLGDELVEVLGATPEGAWRFQLPRYEPVIGCVIRGEPKPLDTHLDTFLIDADEMRVELAFRAFIPLPRKSELVERIVVTSKSALPDSVFPLQQGEARESQDHTAEHEVSA